MSCAGTRGRRLGGHEHSPPSITGTARTAPRSRQILTAPPCQAVTVLPSRRPAGVTSSRANRLVPACGSYSKPEPNPATARSGEPRHGGVPRRLVVRWEEFLCELKAHGIATNALPQRVTHVTLLGCLAALLNYTTWPILPAIERPGRIRRRRRAQRPVGPGGPHSDRLVGPCSTCLRSIGRAPCLVVSPAATLKPC
jgi:hypothetical protein